MNKRVAWKIFKRDVNWHSTKVEYPCQVNQIEKAEKIMRRNLFSNLRKRIHRGE